MEISVTQASKGCIQSLSINRVMSPSDAIGLESPQTNTNTNKTGRKVEATATFCNTAVQKAAKRRQMTKQ